MKELSLDELHKKQLDMLIAFDKFCHDNGLEYFLAYGTLIGAVRHNGFIPWDDDVDVCMTREHYNKLLSFSKVSDHYRIVTRENSQGYYHPFTYCNIADDETIMQEDALSISTQKGVFLDVFPLDNIPDDPKEAIRYTRRCKRLIRLRSCCLFSNASHGLSRMIKKLISILVNEKRNYDQIQKLAVKYNCVDTARIANVVHSICPEKYIFEKSLYEKAVPHLFENAELMIPVGYDRILRIVYGDYMQFPPENERKASHIIKYYWKNDKHG